MTQAQTDLQPVRFVKDIEPGEVFRDGTLNRLYQTDDDTYVTTSWCEGDEDFQAHTSVWHSDDTGFPTDLMECMNHTLTYVNGELPEHEAALAKFGYQVEVDE